MKVLITGGAGFIGSHLAESYLMDGDEVSVLDDLSTGKRSNIRHLLDDRKFCFTKGTILDPQIVSKLVKKSDVVIHLAAAVGVHYIIQNPLVSIETNLRGTKIVLSMADKYKKKIMLASSSEVYGKQRHAPLCEDGNVIYGPSSTWRWSYAVSKLIGEFEALAYYKTTGLPIIIMRLFNTVGPRQVGDYGMVLPRFIKQALMNQSITVYGNGRQTRTFTYVTDVVRAIKALLSCRGAAGEVINIGGGEEVTIEELAKKVKRMAKSSSTIEFIPYNKVYPRDFEDMLRRVPSLDKLNRLIGFIPQIGLEDIISKTIEYFKTRDFSD